MTLSETHKTRVVLALIAMASVYFFSYFQRTAVPGTIFNEIQTDMNLSASAVTSLGAVFLYVYAGMQLFVGFAADRFGGARVLLLGGLVMCVGAAAFPAARSEGMLYASRAVMAFGASCMYLSIVKEIDALFGGRHFAVVLGCVLLLGYSGGIVGTLPFERVVAACGWRNALFGAAGIMFIVLFLTFLTLRTLGHPAPAWKRYSFAPLWDILRNRWNLPIFISSAINFPIYFVIQAVLGKKFLEDSTGLSSRSAAVFLMISASVTAVSAFTGGFLLRLFAHRRKPLLLIGVAMLLTATILMLYGVSVHARGGLFLVCYVMLAGTMIATPAGSAVMKELNRADSVAMAIAVTNCLAYIGVGVLSNIGGLILDRYRNLATTTATGIVYPPQAYTVLFAVLVGLAVVSTAATFFVRETRGESLYGAVEGSSEELEELTPP